MSLKLEGKQNKVELPVPILKGIRRIFAVNKVKAAVRKRPNNMRNHICVEKVISTAGISAVKLSSYELG